MTTLTSVVKQQPLVAFFVFAYGLSWGNYFLSATYNARESTLLVILFHTAQNTIGGFYLFRVFSGPDLVRLWWLWATLYAVAAAAVVLGAGASLGVRSPTEAAEAVT